jgi:cell division protein FtsL
LWKDCKGTEAAISRRSNSPRWKELLSNQAVRITQADRRGRGRLLTQLLAGIGLVTAVALFAGWVHVQSITLRYRVARMVQLQEDLYQERAALEIERQMLRTPKRISRLAEQEFGMVLPEVEDRVVLR